VSGPSLKALISAADERRSESHDLDRFALLALPQVREVPEQFAQFLRRCEESPLLHSEEALADAFNDFVAYFERLDATRTGDRVECSSGSSVIPDRTVRLLTWLHCPARHKQLLLEGASPQSLEQNRRLWLRLTTEFQKLERLRNALAKLIDRCERGPVDSPTVEPNQAQRDATALLQLAAVLGSDRITAEQKEKMREKLRGLEKDRFLKAVTELRIAFLGLLQLKPHTRRPAKVAQATAGSRDLLEWLTRLELQTALVKERRFGAEFDENAAAWLGLDARFGQVENFWAPFQSLLEV